MTAFLLMLAGLYLLFLSFLMEARGVLFIFGFKFFPFVLGAACLVGAWQTYMNAA